MNKIQAIQRSKLNTSYGGVGSTIDTIDNLSYIVDPFNEWPIYKKLENIRHRNDVYPRLIHKEDRLLERIKKVGFSELKEFFLTESFEGEDIKEWLPIDGQIKRMVSSHYFPRMFYCPKCHRLHEINEWKNNWAFGEWEKRVPKCHYCSQKKGKKVFAPNLIQVRFVLASMETGDLRDLPWGQIYAKKGKNDGCPSVWDFTLNPPISERNVTFNIRKGGSDLIDINVKSDNGVIVTMAEIMNHYFVMNLNGRNVAYRPVIRSANNVYFSYVINSVYIPKYVPTSQEIAKIKTAVEEDNWDAAKIKTRYDSIIHLSVQEIQAIIDNDYVVPFPDYSTEEMFRLDEFDCLTNDVNYKDGVFADDEDRLLVEKYEWSSQPISCIKQLYLFKRLNVTSAQVAYSRIEKISPSYLASWKGKSENPKFWYDVNSNSINQNVEVALHPTCEDITNVDRMPVVSSYGEGFFVELDKNKMPKDEIEKAVFLHTLSHLVMKSLEFYCGYPISSMNERLYILPKSITMADEDKYGFMIYSANGEAGSYGGITSLFETGKIETIIRQAFESAEDCPNDPICESEGGSCFACVQIPETACELFNKKLSRNVIKDWNAKNLSVTSDTVE